MRVPTVRQRIVAYLRRRSPATAAQLGQALDVSAASVRHHLSLLVGDGRVVVGGPESSGRRGRPQKMYRLSERVLGENYGVLADLLLGELLRSLPSSRKQARLKLLADGLAQRTGRIDSRLPPMKRVIELTERLNGLYYQAGWEAGAQGPRILFGHCPYAAILAQHPELCQVDGMMLGIQLDADAQQAAKISQEPGGATHCVFVLRPLSGVQPG